MNIAGRFRFQNVTKSSGAEESNGNINAVDANPLSGKIFTYRNQAPLFSNSYLTGKDTAAEAPFRAGVEDLQSVSKDFEMYATATNGKGGAAFILPAAPLNPSSIWRNVSSTGVVTFPPGGFKTYTTSYVRSGTIRKYIQEISQTDLVAPPQYSHSHHGAYPPAGDSFMMCLRPTLKTTSEAITVAYDTEYVLTGSMKRRRASPLQVVNDIKA